MSSLEKRISSALVDDIKSADLAALTDETAAAITAAEKNVVDVRAKALDPLEVADADAARAMVETAKFAVARLKALLPRLQARLMEVRASERAAKWEADYMAVEIERDECATEFAATYPEVVAELVDLLRRAAAIDAKCSRVNEAAPSGERRRLLCVERVARGSSGGDMPSIAKALQVPDWEHSGQMVWPPRVPRDMTMFAPVPYDPRYSPNWETVRDARADAIKAEQARIADYYEQQERAREERNQSDESHRN